MFVSAFYEGHGSFADECLALSSTAFPVPAGLPDAEAAGFWIPHVTAWTGLVERGHLAAGEWLAVLGAAGGSGIAAVQLGRALGARVIAVVGDSERADFCRRLGAETAINHRDGPLAPALGAATGGRGIDVIYDPVGGAMAEEAATALARNGRHLAVGFASGRWPELPAHDLVLANTSLVGVFAGGQSPAELDEIHDSLSRLIDQGRLRSAVTATPTFDELPTALQAARGSHHDRQAGDDPVSRAADFDLDADEIITAAVEIFRESGLDAVSMRSVATRLGVSPVPLYSRIGNKDALVDAIADRLFANLSPPRAPTRSAGAATRPAGQANCGPSSSPPARAASSSCSGAKHLWRCRDHSSRPCARTASTPTPPCKRVGCSCGPLSASWRSSPERGRRVARVKSDPGATRAASTPPKSTPCSLSTSDI